jgi:hypothetical protein
MAGACAQDADTIRPDKIARKALNINRSFGWWTTE